MPSRSSWDFYGTTEAPQQGKIACGYFVSTVLCDAGWRLQRFRLAQQASENIILSLASEPHVKRFRRVPISDFVNAVEQWGPGLFVVGLDIHTGFIVNTGGEVYFIHSSYEPYVVVRTRRLNQRPWLLQTTACWADIKRKPLSEMNRVSFL